MNKIFNAWMKSPAIIDSMKTEMQKMSIDDINLAFKDEAIAFGTAGYRAKMGPGNMWMNEVTYQQLTMGYGREVQEKYKNMKAPLVVIGHDNRNNSSRFALIAAKTLTWMGLKVKIFEDNILMPTPIISYVIPRVKAQGGIIITASHNPKEQNGFKIYDETGSQYLPGPAARVVELMPTWEKNLTYKVVQNNILLSEVKKSLIQRYFADVKSCLFNTDISKKKDYPVIFTAHHGTASRLMPMFLQSIGYNVIPVKEQCYPDGNFTNSPSSNPEDSKSFDLGIKWADENKSDLILACDPDADRLGVAVRHKGKWRFLSGNETGIILTEYILKYRNFKGKKPIVVSTYVSNDLIDRIAKHYNTHVIRTATGFKWVGDQINKLADNEVYAVGFEEAIGSLATDLNRDKDSFQAAAILLEINTKYKEHNMDLIDILEKEIYPKYGSWYGITVPCLIPGGDWKLKALRFMKDLTSFPTDHIGDRKIIQISYNEAGSCLEWELEAGSWLKFRLSGTEPKFKIYFNLYNNDKELEKKNSNGEVTKALQNETKNLTNFIKEYLNIE